MSNSQLNKLKSVLKNGTEITLNLSSNVIGDSIDETYFPRKFLLIDTQISRLLQDFSSASSANIKFSKPRLLKMVQLGGFLGRLCI